MKGIILAGGNGSRLFPITKSITKQLLPIYDKPMIYYPLWTLMNAKIRDIMIIVSYDQLNNFKNLLGDGSDFGINIVYGIQNEANGLPEAFIIGEKFIDNKNIVFMLGDNIFYGEEFISNLYLNIIDRENSLVFLYESLAPNNFGVAEIVGNKLINIEEKPKEAKSNYVVTGLYLYDGDVSYYAKNLIKSERGELEISDLNNIYIKHNKLDYKILCKNTTWFDTGTFDSLFEANKFIDYINKNKNFNIGVLEEIAYKNGWISSYKLEKQAFKYKNNSYGKYLNKIINEV